MLRQFKKKCERAGIIQECKKREFYEKPSAKRQRKKNGQTQTDMDTKSCIDTH